MKPSTKAPTTATNYSSSLSSSQSKSLSPTSSTTSINGTVYGVIGGICGIFLAACGCGGGYLFYRHRQREKTEKSTKIHIDTDDESQQAEEGGFSPAKVLVLVTSLKQAAPAGATKLDLYSHVDCQPGMLVTLSNPHDPHVAPEQRWIIAIVLVVILDRPLDHAYDEGTIVTVTKKPSTTSGGSVLDNNFANIHKCKPTPTLGVFSKSMLTMSAKSDVSVSGKSTSMSVSGRMNHSNRIYPMHDCLTVESSSSMNIDYNNRRKKEMKAVNEAERMRLEVEAEEDEDAEENLLQLEEEKKGREAAMQRRLQSALMQEAKQRMQKQHKEEKDTDERVEVEHKEVMPSRPTYKPRATSGKSPTTVPIQKSHQEEEKEMDQPAVVKHREVLSSRPLVSVPKRRPLTAVEHRGTSRQHDDTSRWEQDLLSAGIQTLHWDDCDVNDGDALWNFDSSIGGLLARRISAKQSRNRHLSPLRPRAQSAQPLRRPDAASAAAATSAMASSPAATAALSPPTYVPFPHVIWNDLSVLDAPGDGPMGFGLSQSFTDNDSNLEGQGWTNASSRPFRAGNMHVT